MPNRLPSWPTTPSATLARAMPTVSTVTATTVPAGERQGGEQRGERDGAPRTAELAVAGRREAGMGHGIAHGEATNVKTNDLFRLMHNGTGNGRPFGANGANQVGKRGALIRWGEGAAVNEG